MAIGSAYLHFYRKFSKWLFHKATEEIGVEGLPFPIINGQLYK
jgi:hypothetical protein